MARDLIRIFFVVLAVATVGFGFGHDSGNGFSFSAGITTLWIAFVCIATIEQLHKIATVLAFLKK